MDLLYSRYSNPMELMRIYIDTGRFGEFVTEILSMDEKRKQEEAQKEEDNKLWLAYVLSMSDKSFNEWKDGLKHKKRKEPVSLSMTNEQVNSVKNTAKNILKRFNPSK